MAALAYYTILPLVPLPVPVIAVAGLLWQKDVVRTTAQPVTSLEPLAAHTD